MSRYFSLSLSKSPFVPSFFSLSWVLSVPFRSGTRVGTGIGGKAVLRPTTFRPLVGRDACGTGLRKEGEISPLGPGLGRDGIPSRPWVRVARRRVAFVVITSSSGPSVSGRAEFRYRWSFLLLKEGEGLREKGGLVGSRRLRAARHIPSLLVPWSFPRRM